MNNLVSAFISGSKWVVVLINTGTSRVEQKINIANAPAGEWIPYSTTQTDDAKAGQRITPAGVGFSYVLPPRSVTSFVAQLRACFEFRCGTPVG